MERSNLIQIDAASWIVLREFSQRPKAIINRITDTLGEDRFLLMTWAPDLASRRMVGIYPSVVAAEKEVPWPPTTGVTPKLPPRSPK